MGAKYTEAQKNAYKKYMEDKCELRIVVKKEKADEYRQMAKAEGKSLSQFIIDKLDGAE